MNNYISPHSARGTYSQRPPDVPASDLPAEVRCREWSVACRTPRRPMDHRGIGHADSPGRSAHPRRPLHIRLRHYRVHPLYLRVDRGPWRHKQRN